MHKIININGSWKYYRGAAESAFAQDFDDSRWTWVNLPHNTSLYTSESKNGTHTRLSCTQ